MRKEFLLSLGIHLLILGTAVVFGGQIEDRNSAPPVVVFLNGEMPGGNEGRGDIKDAAPQVNKNTPARVDKKTQIAKKSMKKEVVSSRIKEIQKPEPTALSSDEGFENEALQTSSLSEGLSSGTASAGGGTGGAGSGSGGQGGSGGGTGKGHGTGSGDVNGYLAEHYAYIRELIMKHLKYPQMAKKMGWKGKVVVAFVIKENGSTENSKITASSGYEMLDKNVLSTIKEVQPFPKPPAKAELVIPIVYKLE